MKIRRGVTITDVRRIKQNKYHTSQFMVTTDDGDQYKTKGNSSLSFTVENYAPFHFNGRPRHCVVDLHLNHYNHITNIIGPDAGAIRNSER